MASFQSGVDKVGEEEGKTANKRENVALQKRRLLRNKRSASISSSPSVSLSSPGATSTTSVLDRRNSVHYFLNSEYQSAYQKSMHSNADGQQQQQQSFMAQRVTITRLRSSTDFLRNESDAAQQTLPSTNSVDIDVHVLCGSSSSVISHMNMKKKKVMGKLNCSFK